MVENRLTRSAVRDQRTHLRDVFDPANQPVESREVLYDDGSPCRRVGAAGNDDIDHVATEEWLKMRLARHFGKRTVRLLCSRLQENFGVLYHVIVNQ